MPVWQEWDWQLKGSCREAESELFFSPDSERGAKRQAREEVAKSYCAGCPVLAQCRAHALAVREPYGVWGGLTPAERDALVTGPAGTPMESLGGTPDAEWPATVAEPEPAQMEKTRSTTALARRVTRR
jgi:WhiB family redox-sensing transcriptional regulator